MKGTKIADRHILSALHLKGHALQVFLFGDGEVQAIVDPAVRRPLRGHESIDFLDRPFLKVIFIRGCPEFS